MGYNKKMQLNQGARERICRYVMDGTRKTEIARKLNIGRSTLYKWIDKDTTLREMYNIACQVFADDCFEQILAEVRDRSKDTLMDVDGIERPNAAAVGRSKLVAHWLEKVAMQNNRKKYDKENKLDITSGGEAIKGFMGLVITPPKEGEDEDVDQEQTSGEEQL